MRDGRADLRLDVVADDRAAGVREPLLPVGLARNEDGHAVDHRDARLEDLLRVPLRRRLGADGEVVDDDVGPRVLEDLHDVVGRAGRLLDDLREVLADPVVRHPARDRDPGVRDVGELDRVVRVRPDRVGEVDADLALDDVERGGELDVRDVVPAEVDVHQARDGVLRLRVLVVLDALEEGVGAVADADDRDAHLVLLAPAVLGAVRAGHEVLSLAVALCRDAEPFGERGEDDVVRVGVATRRLRLDLVSQLRRHPEQEDGARPGEHPAAAPGRGEWNAELVGEDSDGDVVDVGSAPGGFPHERAFQRGGHPDEDSRALL